MADLDLTGLERSVNGACDTIDQLRAQRNELLAALKAVLAGFDSGVFVRNISRDSEQDWAIKTLESCLRPLHAAAAAIAKAEGR